MDEGGKDEDGKRKKKLIDFFHSIAMATQESQTSLLSTVMQQEMAQRRQRAGISRQDSRLSVKSLIESIEKSSTHVRIGNLSLLPISMEKKTYSFNFNLFLFCFYLQVKSNGQTGDSHSSSSSINSLMSDAPILQTRSGISEWSSDSSNMIVDQSKVYTCTQIKSAKRK